MKKILIFTLGVLIGTFIGLLFYRNGLGSNSGSEFWGDRFADFLKGTGKGVGNNNGSKFYSDIYIKEKFKSENNLS